jgi:cbb3-type cytochrome c oxidase subunit III
VRGQLNYVLGLAIFLGLVSSIHVSAPAPAAAAAPAALTPAAPPDGKALFGAKCAACHQATGLGGGPYPPLAGNDMVTSADTSDLILTVLNGRSGPIQVEGKTYSGAMPAWRGQLSNAEIAAVLTYVRSAWANKAAIVTGDQVSFAANPTAQSGAGIFVAKCMTCHQKSGEGSTAYPPLAGNPRVTAADPKEMIATIVNGKTGTISVAGMVYNGQMPTWKGQLSNSDIAAVATYVRSSWNNKAAAVSEQEVAAAGPSVLTTVGASVYSARCAACHKANGGGGQGGMFPALAGNANVTAADPKGLLETISHGRNMMPSWKGQLSAGDIAAVATFIRSAWGNKAGPVTEGDAASVK